MDIVICGAGKVGFSLAKYLSDRGNSVTVVDTNKELIDSINQKLDVKAICGQASHPDVLKSIHLEQADILIAVTHIDEVNMITCEVAHALFQVPKKIARVRSQSYLKLRGTGFFTENNLSIDYVISPEGEVAQALARKFAFPGVFDDAVFLDGRLHLIGVKCEVGKLLYQMTVNSLQDMLCDLDAKIVAFVRNGQSVVPLSDCILDNNDEVFIIAKTDDITAILLRLGYSEHSTDNIIIIGGGNIGLFFAQEVEANYPNIELRIIEKNNERASYIAQKLDRAIVIKGDGLDKDVLQEAGIEHNNVVVSVTADDKVNTLSTVLAKRLGCNKTLCLSNDKSFAELAISLGADAVINPKEVTISKIMQYIRREQINSLYSLGDGIGEIFDIDATNTSNLVGKSINEIGNNSFINVIAIVRDKEIIIPHQDEIVELSDRLLLMLYAGHTKKAYDIIGIR